MTTIRTIFARLAAVAANIRSAAAVAAAVEGGRRPRPEDLRRLGIDTAAFGAIARG